MDKKHFLFILILLASLPTLAQHHGYSEPAEPWKYSTIQSMVGDSFYLYPMYEGYINDLLKKSYVHNEKGKLVKAIRYVEHTALNGDFFFPRVVTIKGGKYAEFISHNLEIYLPIERMGQMLEFIYSYSFWDDTLAACNKKYGAIKTNGSFYRNHIGNSWDKNKSDQNVIVFEDYQYDNSNHGLIPVVIIRVGTDQTKELSYFDFCKLLNSGTLITQEELKKEQELARKLEKYDSLEDANVHLFVARDVIYANKVNVSIEDAVSSDILYTIEENKLFSDRQLRIAEGDTIPIFLYRPLENVWWGKNCYFSIFHGDIISLRILSDATSLSYFVIDDPALSQFSGYENYFRRRELKNIGIRAKVASKYDTDRRQRERELAKRKRIQDSIQLKEYSDSMFRHYDSVRFSLNRTKAAFMKQYPYGVASVSFDLNSLRGVEPTIIWMCLNEKVKIKYIQFSIKAYNKVGDLIGREYSHQSATYKFTAGESCFFSGTGECTYYEDWAADVKLGWCKVQTYDGVWHNVNVSDKAMSDYAIYHTGLMSLPKEPEYPGGEAALLDYIMANKIYPQEARDNNITGVVWLEFEIGKDGYVSNIQVKEDIGGGCGAEAVRLIKSMPRWLPGLDSKKVSYPVHFYPSLRDQRVQAK